MSHPHVMKMSPWLYWCMYAVMTGGEEGEWQGFNSTGS